MGTQSKTLITRDGVELEWGLLSEGQSLVVSGSYIEGGAAAPNSGTVILDFGTVPTDTGSVSVTGQTWVTTASNIRAWFQVSDFTATNSFYDHWMASTIIPLSVGGLVLNGFTIFAIVTMGKATGTFVVHWEGL